MEQGRLSDCQNCRGFKMAEESKVQKDSPQLPIVLEELERRVKEIVYGDKVNPGVIDHAMKAVAEVAQKAPGGVKAALDLITDLIEELTGVQSFKITPRPPLALEVEIRSIKETDLKLKKLVAPMVEVESLKLGKRIHFEALLNQQKKGLQISIHEGFTLKFNHGPLLGATSVDIKGSGVLKRDESGLAVELTTKIPGTDQDVQITVPIKQILEQARKL